MSFKDELQKVTKTKEQIQQSENNEFVKSIETEYYLIKEKLLDVAKNGQYTVSNGHKIIMLDYKSWILESLILRQHKNIIINKTFFNPSGQSANEVTYSIKDQNKYNILVNTLKRLSKEDDTSITPIMLNYRDDNDFHFIPCKIQGYAATVHSYEPRLRCQVEY